MARHKQRRTCEGTCNVDIVPQAVPKKHDIGVPAPFQPGQVSEASLGVSIHLPAGANAEQNGAAEFTHIAQVGLDATAYANGHLTQHGGWTCHSRCNCAL